MSPDVSCDPTIDLALDAEQLRSKYDALALLNQWGEHPVHSMELWQTEVYCKNTRDGYWQWVVTKLNVTELNVTELKNDKVPVSADAEKKEIVELQAEDPGNQGA